MMYWVIYFKGLILTLLSSWVFKGCKDKKTMSDMPCSIDDGRHMAHNRVTCLKTTQCFCSQIGWLGMQDASNKWTESMLIPEPIARSVLHTNGQMLLTVSHHKWLKTQSCIEELDQLLHTSSLLPKLRLEQICGFLIMFCTPLSGLSLISRVSTFPLMDGSQIWSLYCHCQAPIWGDILQGTLPSKKLNDITFCLRNVQWCSSIILHDINVAGTKMKGVGINGLLRGDFMEGIMTLRSNPAFLHSFQ